MSDDTTRPFSNAEALRFGWQTTQANLKPLMTLGAVGAFLALLHQSLLGHDATGMRPLLAQAIQVLQLCVTLAFIKVSLRLHDGQPVDLSRPAELLKGFFPFLFTNILFGLIVATGTLLLIVPGVLWALRFGYAGFLTVEGASDPVEALRQSARLTEGVRGPLFVFALSLMAVNVLGALALGVGLFVSVPTTFLASAYVFRRLQARAATRVHAGAQPVTSAPATALPEHA